MSHQSLIFLFLLGSFTVRDYGVDSVGIFLNVEDVNMGIAKVSKLLLSR